MYRGCKRAGICEDYEDQERSNIQFKVLTCSECKEHYCNSSDTVRGWPILITLLTYLVRTLFQ